MLGHGGFGITYLAWDTNLQIKLAVKEYMPRDCATRNSTNAEVSTFAGEAKENFAYGLERFLEEARTLAKFQQHAGIVSVLNFFKANGTGYMVMEYVDGLTLKGYLADKDKLSWEQTLKLFMPVMDALREVHKHDMLHRDISPDNIYLCEDNRIKLLDFGAARYAMGGHSQTLSVVVKPGYAPEEQYREKGKQGAWTDVYSVAASMYRCITGVVPPDALDRLDEDELASPSALGAQLPIKAEKALLAALAVKATNRTQSIEDFQQALWEKTASAPVTAMVEALPKIEPAQPPKEQPAPWVSSNQKPRQRQVPKSKPSPWADFAKKNKYSLVVGLLICFAAGGSFLSSIHADQQAAVEEGVKYFKQGNYAKALSFIRPAAEQGNAKAQSRLGYMYSEGKGVSLDNTLAAEWYRKAADLGDGRAQTNLGVMYSEGKGVPQNYTLAVEWYRKAAEQGHAMAQYNLGVMYDNGQGVLQDYAQAVQWYRKAADQGYAMAQFNLGLLYGKGKGIQQDSQQAAKWIRKAADQGEKNAIEALRKAAVRGDQYAIDQLRELGIN